MGTEIQLAQDERVAGRPFVDPENTRTDAEALQGLLGHLRGRAAAWNGTESAVRVREMDGDGHRHLLVVPDTRALLETRNPTIVGFFGRSREDADEPALFALEEELVAGMGAYAADGLLSYYDVELVKGAYGNLILFTGPDGPHRWRENPVHARAVEISPANYEHIRLHQGMLPGRLFDGEHLRVRRTRYLDYRGTSVWRAVRRYDEVPPTRS